jgi:hypothetical protein
MLQQILAILMPERREAIGYILGNGEQRVLMKKLQALEWEVNIES